MNVCKFVYFLLCMSVATIGQAELLWDNGHHDNFGNGVNNQYNSVLDDFYVPGGGWYVNKVEAYGIFLNPNRVVTSASIIIWPTDIQTGEPNGDNVIVAAVTNLSAINTGVSWEGYEKIKIEIDFDEKYLQGQEYYWIELDIRDQYGDRIKLLERQSINYLSAHIRSNPYPSETQVDLGYRLFGRDVHTINLGQINKFKVGSSRSSTGTVDIQLVGTSKKIKPGFYQMKLNLRKPVMYFFDENGKQEYDYQPNPKAPVKLSTPLGDSMCGKAPSGLQQYCQSFVACYAYDFFCPQL